MWHHLRAMAVSLSLAGALLFGCASASGDPLADEGMTDEQVAPTDELETSELKNGKSGADATKAKTKTDHSKGDKKTRPHGANKHKPRDAGTG